MRPREILSEAFRNVWTGVSRPLILALAFALLVGGMVILDLRTVVGVNRQITQWRASGASVTVVYAPGGIDGAACEALAGAAGIVASGATRQREHNLSLPALPLGAPSYVEVTPGFARLIATAAGGSQTPYAATPEYLARGGLLLADSLAATLNRGPGSTLVTGEGEALVAGAYATPDDGRQNLFSYSVLAQVPAEGRFDYCWAEVWPPDSTAASLLLTVADVNQPEVELRVDQFNARFGTELDPAALYRDRVTRFTPAVVALAGLLLGLVGVRLRRLEFASALHAGVSRPALALQVTIETGVWLALGLVLAAPAVWFAAYSGNSLPAGPWAAPTGVAAAFAVAGTLTGVVIGLALTREEHLFRYFKNR
jgi:hypothetical protein